jgi:glycogen synthase
LGRLKIRKGFDVALKAFASIAGRFPEARLVVAGDGPERPSLERQAAQLGIDGVVDFIGWVAPEDVPALVTNATVVVMPSRHEPFGLVALDAALMARPIVASRVGGLMEVVTHGKSGLLVEPDDSAGLAEALAFLLENRDLAAEMGRIARRSAQTVFSWNRCVDGYDELYQKLARSAG